MFLLNLINFFLAVSTTLIFSITPFFVTEDLGLSKKLLMIIESSNEGMSNFCKIASGFLVDKFQRVKRLIMSSIIFGLFSKLFLFMGGASGVIAAKSFERLSNGVFAVVRDTTVALTAKNNQTGKAYRGMMSVKTTGCLVGSFLASFLVEMGVSFRAIIWVSVIPVILSMIFCLYLQKEKISNNKSNKFNFNTFISEMKLLNKNYYYILCLVFMFMMARFSDGLISIRLKELGLPQWFYLSSIGIFNTMSLFCVFFTGSICDKVNKNLLLWIPILSLLGCHLLFTTDVVSFGVIGVLLWGAQRGTSQLLFGSIIAESLPKKIKGTGIGLYYIVSSLGSILSALVVGNKINNSTTTAFYYGMIVMCVVALFHFIYMYKNIIFKTLRKELKKL